MLAQPSRLFAIGQKHICYVDARSISSARSTSPCAEDAADEPYALGVLRWNWCLLRSRDEIPDQVHHALQAPGPALSRHVLSYLPSAMQILNFRDWLQERRQRLGENGVVSGICNCEP